MCGLFGGISHWLSQNEIETIQGLGVVSVLRGRYGAGLAIVPETAKKKIEILRTEYPAPDILLTTDFDKAVKSRPCVIMGHTRHPTSGGQKMEDIHPHEVGNIIGMHNGTLEKVGGVRVAKNENDSRLLFTAINNMGVEKAFINITGSYALSWINKVENTLNFLRSLDRPLCFASVVGQGSTLYWASKQSFLEFILNEVTDQDINYYVLPPNRLVTFQLRNKEAIKVEGSRVIPSGNSEFAVHTTPSQALLPPPAGVDKSVPILGPDGKVVGSAVVPKIAQPGARYETAKGSYLSYDELKITLGVGCWLCGQTHTMADWSKGGALHWMSIDEYMCYDCWNEHSKQQAAAHTTVQ